jgi:hypothetical protein
MSKTFPRIMKTAALLVLASLVTTFASYVVVTDRHVPLDALEKYTFINGTYAINLPCAGNPGTYPDNTLWMSSEPYLPEARGLPFNYHFWNPCYGHQILRTPFLVDLTCWFLLYAAAYPVYLSYKSHRGHNRKQ